jgi:hypothetical protein
MFHASKAWAHTHTYIGTKQVARFVLVQHTKMGKIYLGNNHIGQCPQNRPIGRKIDQMDIRYLYQYLTFPQIGIVWFDNISGNPGPKASYVTRLFSSRTVRLL